MSDTGANSGPGAGSGTGAGLGTGAGPATGAGSGAGAGAGAATPAELHRFVGSIRAQDPDAAASGNVHRRLDADCARINGTQVPVNDLDVGVVASGATLFVGSTPDGTPPLVPMYRLNFSMLTTKRRRKRAQKHHEDRAAQFAHGRLQCQVWRGWDGAATTGHGDIVRILQEVPQPGSTPHSMWKHYGAHLRAHTASVPGTTLATANLIAWGKDGDHWSPCTPTMRGGAGVVKLPWKGDDDEAVELHAWNEHAGPGVSRALDEVIHRRMAALGEGCPPPRDVIHAHLYQVFFEAVPSECLRTWVTADGGAAAALVEQGIHWFHESYAAEDVGERLTMWVDMAALVLARETGRRLPLFQPALAMDVALGEASDSDDTVEDDSVAKGSKGTEAGTAGRGATQTKPDRCS